MSLAHAHKRREHAAQSSQSGWSAAAGVETEQNLPVAHICLLLANVGTAQGWCYLDLKRTQKTVALGWPAAAGYGVLPDLMLAQLRGSWINPEPKPCYTGTLSVK